MSAVGTALIGAGATIASGAINNAMSYGMSSNARWQNYNYGERAANNADARTRALYNDLQSPNALLQQYQEAGLSPSLMFSGGGGQGAQPSAGAEGSGAAGITPQTYGVDIGQAISQAAQVKLMEAEAEKASAEAENIRNYGGSEAEARIADLLASAGIKDAQRQMVIVQTRITEATEADTIQQMSYTTKKLYKQVEKLTYDVMSAQAQATVDQATVDERIKTVKLNNSVLEATADNILSKTKLQDEQRELVKAQVIATANEIAQKWYSLSLEKARTQSYDDYVKNMHEFQSEQIKLGRERLEHDIAIDWAKFGLDCAELLKNFVEFSIGEYFQNIRTIIGGGKDAVFKAVTK